MPLGVAGTDDEAKSEHGHVDGTDVAAGVDVGGTAVLVGGIGVLVGVAVRVGVGVALPLSTTRLSKLVLQPLPLPSVTLEQVPFIPEANVVIWPAERETSFISYRITLNG